MQDDEYKVQGYQDDLDDGNRPDPFMDEEAENPANGFGIPDTEFKTELDKEMDDESEDFDSDTVDIEDDERNSIEDLDDDTVNDRGY